MTTDFDPIPRDDVEELVWAMLDDHISAGEFQRLEELLRGDEDARRLYLQCVQLHVDLQQWFNPKNDVVPSGPIGLPLDMPLPSGESSLADPAM